MRTTPPPVGGVLGSRTWVRLALRTWVQLGLKPPLLDRMNVQLWMERTLPPPVGGTNPPPPCGWNKPHPCGVVVAACCLLLCPGLWSCGC